MSSVTSHFIERLHIWHACTVFETKSEGHTEIPGLELIQHLITNACYILPAIFHSFRR